MLCGEVPTSSYMLVMGTKVELPIICFSDFYGKMRLDIDLIDLFLVGLSCDNVSI